uniref:Uncharacterized protein n=1 Tax=Setaria italica TaxID=4555 RepID=K3Z0A9_SETIT
MGSFRVFAFYDSVVQPKWKVIAATVVGDAHDPEKFNEVFLGKPEKCLDFGS